MKKFLTQDDIKTIEARLKIFEERTSCELLLIHANASDEYPAAALRFGMISGVILTIIYSLFYEFHHAYFWPMLTFILMIIFTWIGNFSWAKRFALTEIETRRESEEKAIECFYKLGTSKVSHKVTAMIMVSMLEKVITVLVDEKLKEKITSEDLTEVVSSMKEQIKLKNISLGFIKSIDVLEGKILKEFNGKVSDTPPSELSDKMHFL